MHGPLLISESRKARTHASGIIMRRNAQERIDFASLRRSSRGEGISFERKGSGDTRAKSIRRDASRVNCFVRDRDLRVLAFYVEESSRKSFHANFFPLNRNGACMQNAIVSREKIKVACDTSKSRVSASTCHPRYSLSTFLEFTLIIFTKILNGYPLSSSLKIADH